MLTFEFGDPLFSDGSSINAPTVSTDDPMKRLVNERPEFAITDATARIQNKLLSLLQSLRTIVERRGIPMQQAHLAFLTHIGIKAATIPIYVGSSGGSISAPQELRANA